MWLSNTERFERAVDSRVHCGIGRNEGLTTSVNTEYIVIYSLEGGFSRSRGRISQCLEGQGFRYSADILGISSSGFVSLNSIPIVS